MNKWFILVFLALTACAQSSCEQTGTAPSPDDYQRGLQGVDITFLQDAPQDQVYEETPFAVVMSLHNKGSTCVPFELCVEEPDGFSFDYESAPGFITINYDPFYLIELEQPAVVEARENIELRGKGELVPEGQEKIIRIGDFQAKKVVGQRESPETQIFVNFCYPYKTTLSTEICIDASKRLRNLRQQACNAKDLTFSGGQGAPVAITNIEVDMVPYGDVVRPQFVIHVENLGKGTVITALGQNAQEACSQQINPIDANTLTVYGHLAGIDLECTPDPFRLIGDNAKIFCMVPGEDVLQHTELFARQDNFVSNLHLRLYYAYSITETAEVEILRRFGTGYTDTYKDVQAECPSWQTEIIINPAGDTGCVDLCGRTEETIGFTCSCTDSECASRLPDGKCIASAGLCSGNYCCQQNDVCEDVIDEDECIELNQIIGCKWCVATEECAGPQEPCPEAEPVEN